MDKPDQPAIKLVGALHSGISILRYLSTRNAPAGVTQVARDLSLNPSTCFNLLRTLAHEKLVTFNTETKTYQIGLGLVEIAQSALNSASLVRMIQPIIDDISARHQITVTLCQKMEDDRVMMIANAETASYIRIHMAIGQRLPLFIGALGRCFAAFSDLSKAELKKEYSKLRFETPLPFEDWLASLEDVRRNYFAIDKEHFNKGFTTVSAPIFNLDNRPGMAISAVTVTAQITDQKLQDIAVSIREAGKQISATIQGAPIPPQ
ncbi:IclR family transcriptional regulator [Sneathiella chinensis]|uniref:Transcriptional regulator n=1 Tax=Sneathiella chinensis TaxID=349750 RepID=A0ABQ5U6A5_9PROT|nr:IclR family transcriptional regulator [Sneathiella chinensis]GLQ06789.1 transcriptional regulator [Sneathiella chinensis]